MGTRIGIVVIGRNEGDRLKACLRSIAGAAPTVYVDSGSDDGSQDFARSLGVAVVELAVPPGFTAARARNAGLAALMAARPALEFVQMVDGDCEVASGWLDAGTAALQARQDLAAVFGRRRERHPDRSIYNRLCDDEWDVPIGPALSTGGDAMFRIAPLLEAGGYTESLIAGEEPDLCLRMRQAGWRIERIDHEMTRHDANITRWPQWWRRTTRAGYAFAEHVARHGGAARPHFRRAVARMRLWALILPTVGAAAFLVALAGWRWAAIAGAAIVLLYPAQIARLTWRDRHRWPTTSVSLQAAWFSLLGKFAELAGARRYARDRRRQTSSGLIEYKR